ncbi:MAG: hypothetical protein FK733_07370 [Asgard group archaeon]|nr:hypothetical protein [Asgard group archaeon]
MNSKCSHCGGILEKDSNFCHTCGGTTQITKLKTVEKLHSGYSIASIVLGCFGASVFLWLTQVIFYKIPAVVDAFAGRYVTRDIISISIDGFFLLLGVLGLVLGIIGIRRKRTILSISAIAVNALFLVAGSFRLFILSMVYFVF